MKIISFPKPFLSTAGTPFQTRKRDEKGNFVPRTTVKGEIIRDSDGNIMAETEDADFPRVVKDFVENVFVMNRRLIDEAKALKKDLPAEMTLEDSSKGIDIIRAANVATDGKIELEGATYKWLTDKIEHYGVKLVGIDAGLLHEVVSAATEKEPSRAERRREEREKKE